MRSSLMRAAAYGVAVLALVLAVTPSRGDDRCIEAFEHAQELRAAHQLLTARSEFDVCAAPTCPALTTKDCARWRDEVAAEIPSIVVKPKRGDADMPDAHVSIDGKPVESNGAPIEVDPGKHDIECRAGDQVATAAVTIESKDKGREIACTFAAPASGPRGLFVAGLVVGSVGIAAVAIGAGFEIRGLVARSDLEDTCYPHCSHDDVESAKTSLLVGDVTLALGLVAVGAATAMLVVDITKRPKIAPAGASVSLGVTPGGLSLRGAF